MATFARLAMRASMMLTILLVTLGAFLAARTPAQHLTVALSLFLYCAIRSGGLAVLERSELVQRLDARQTPADLVRLRDERRRSRVQATIECAFLALVGVTAALKAIPPTPLLH